MNVQFIPARAINGVNYGMGHQPFTYKHRGNDMVKDITYKNEKCCLFRYDSLSDFYRAVDYAFENSNKCKTIGAKPEAHRFRYAHNKSFSGLYYEDALKTRYAYKDGVNSIHKMQGIEIALKASEYKKVWSDYDGDAFDVERYRNEQPFLSRRVKTIGAKNRGMFRVYINIAESCVVSYENMLWKTWTACRICDELENQGHRVEIVVCGEEHDQHYNYKISFTEIVVKRFSDPFNVALLASVCSPWFFRIWLFIVWNFYKKAYSNLGYPHQIAEYYNVENDKTAILIDNGDCLSEESANNFIRTLDIGSEFGL